VSTRVGNVLLGIGDDAVVGEVKPSPYSSTPQLGTCNVNRNPEEIGPQCARIPQTRQLRKEMEKDLLHQVVDGVPRPGGAYENAAHHDGIAIPKDFRGGW
jgi:hypothetical protein